MDIKIWKKEFVSELSANGWLCGKCFSGNLSVKLNPSPLVTKDNFFSVYFKCTNPKCNADHTSIGSIRYYSQEFKMEVNKVFAGVKYKRFYPKYFVPTLALFKIPDNTPIPVAAAIQQSFDLFWSDIFSSANAIRRALEFLMDEFEIQKIKLHGRIERFFKINPDVSEMLLAIKWIGNAGTHGDVLTKDDVLDAYEILEQSLIDLYPSNNIQRLKAIAKEINTKKGVRSK